MKIKQHGLTPGEPQDWAPVYFTSLTVRNFRCFAGPQILNLARPDGRPAPWTVIVGENGVGKTTLLQCLAGLLPEYVNSAQTSTIQVRAEEPFKVEYMFTPKVCTFAWLEFLEKGLRNPDEKLNIECSLYMGDTLTRTIRSPDNEPSQEWGVTYSKDLLKKHSFSLSVIQDVKLRYGGLVCYGYGAASRLASNAIGDQVSHDTIATLFNSQASLPNAEEWLLTLDHVAKTSGDSQQGAVDRRTRALDILTNILPGVEEIRFGIVELGKIRPEFRTPYGWVTMDKLGLGFQSMIAWVLDFVRRMLWRYPESSNPLAEPAVVLIDELDMHLHPSWQRSVMKYLSETFPGTQFIATVHSPLVIQAAADSANIAVLRPCEGSDGKMQVVIDNDPENVRGWRLDQIMSSDLYNLPPLPNQFEWVMDRRRTLLSKPHLNEDDTKELADLNKRAHMFPTEETAEDRKAMQVLRDAATILDGLK